jgi:hypothetical protein
MARSLSVDLRRRVVGAIEEDCRVDRQGSDSALTRRGRSGCGLNNSARTILGRSSRAATAIRNGLRRMLS